ncbi:MAG: hypothetical protein QNK37_31715 [Acidobacteriota bacterium]|nr:hypothetical protein [Acidobacteriota bacterium]
MVQTPAPASRNEVEDMARMGPRNLMVMLSFIPGFVVMDAEISRD